MRMCMHMHSRIGVHNLAHHATWSKLSLSSCITTPLVGRRRKVERVRKVRKKTAIVDLAHHVPNIRTVKGLICKRICACAQVVLIPTPGPPSCPGGARRLGTS